jgi:hypothetical protein
VYRRCDVRNGLLVGRLRVESDEVGGLLQAAGRGDVDAFAAFYDRTASLVFALLRHAYGESAAAERLTGGSTYGCGGPLPHSTPA